MAKPAYETPAQRVHETLGKWMMVDGLDLVYDAPQSRGSLLHDSRTGQDYLDLFSFFASMPVSHNHPGLADEGFREKLLAAALVKPSNSDVYTQAMADFVSTFGRTVPDGFKHLFFIEGGALAVENALKAAFDWKVRKNIARGLVSGDGDPDLGTKVIHFRGAFHGRTGYTLSLTNGASPNKTKFFPKFKWPRVSTPGMRFPVEDNLEQIQASEKQSLAEIKQAIANHPNEIAALIIETIQGEGGDVHFRPEFMKALRTICDESEMLLIFDEVQAGMGITGKWWAFENHGIQPDIFAFGKKAQVCGIASTDRVDEVESVFQVPSRINSTWGGNLVDMVRVSRYIEIIEQENLLANAAEVGSYLLQRMRELETQVEAISNSRGSGLMCAFDLPDSATRDRAQKAIMNERALMLPCGSVSLRFRPVLDFRREDVDLAMERITKAMKSL